MPRGLCLPRVRSFYKSTVITAQAKSNDPEDQDRIPETTRTYSVLWFTGRVSGMLPAMVLTGVGNPHGGKKS